MKGIGHTYRPEINEECLVSGPNCDDENGYVFSDMTLLWKDDTFGVFRKDGRWPVVYKWDHIICKVKAPFN